MAEYTIDLGTEFEQQLNQVAKDKSLSKVEIVRRAVATYVVISREAGQGGKVTARRLRRRFRLLWAAVAGCRRTSVPEAFVGG